MRRPSVSLPGGLPADAASLQSGRLEGIPRVLALREIPSGSPWAAMVRRFLRHRMAVASFFLLAVLYLGGLFAEFIAPYPSGYQRTSRLYAPPQLPRFTWRDGWHVHGLRMQRDPLTLRRVYAPDSGQVIPLSFFVKGEPYRLWDVVSLDRHLFGVDYSKIDPALAERGQDVFNFLGADKFGRDVFSRLVFGARVSLSIGLVSIAITLVLGVLIGGISGYAGGAVDVLIQRLIEVLNSIPQLPFWLALAAVLPAEASPLFVYFAITVVLGLVGWAELARVVRGKVLSLREEEFVTAARLIGASPTRVLTRHLLPGVTSHVLVVMTMSVPSMILGETSLSFLGLGLRTPVVSWGVMLQDTMSIQSVANYPWLLMPAVLIVLTVLCFNFLGDGLRDTADPHTYGGSVK
ncbi:peptide ABC transporter permease [Opitutaceae bacterium EW11]|nr:peptide ABC transporter permease [Opitutaceae bacterium EW11]